MKLNPDALTDLYEALNMLFKTYNWLEPDPKHDTAMVLSEVEAKQ